MDMFKSLDMESMNIFGGKASTLYFLETDYVGYVEKCGCGRLFLQAFAFYIKQ